MSIRLTIGADDAGRRLDRLLRKHYSDLPLSAIHRLLRTGRVRIDGKKVTAADRPSEGSVLELPELEGLLGGADRGHPSSPPPKGLKLDIVWEDASLLVVSKPAGLLVHGPQSLEDHVLAYLEGKLSPSLSFRPGPLHRLDRGTSGIVTFSKSLDGAQRFSAALQARTLRKRYLALLEGSLTREEHWEDELIRDREGRRTEVQDASEANHTGNGTEGKTALSRAIPLSRTKDRTLALIEIGTGRTHQIRSQAAAHGFPLAGDGKYGGSMERNGFLLHAYELASSPEAELPFPPVLVARPPEGFLASVEGSFGHRLAEMLAAALPTDAILDAIM